MDNITVKQLKHRLMQIEQAIDQARLHYNTLLGRQAELQDWINQAEQPADKSDDAEKE